MYTNTSDLLEKLSELASADKDSEEFFLNAKTWLSFTSKVIEQSKFPKVYAIASTLELIAFIGLAENAGQGEGFREKFFDFLSNLNRDEKLLFVLAIKIKQTNPQTNLIYQQYLKTGGQDLLEKLMESSREDDMQQDQFISDLLQAFLDSNDEFLEVAFKKRLKLLYDVRSEIVHKGSPDVIGAMLMGDAQVVSFYGEKGNRFFTIRLSLADFFIRAFFRQKKLSPKSLRKDIEEFLWKEYLTSHALMVAKIVQNLRN